jgi:hypothetical protein
MTLPASGTISLSQVNVEMGAASTAQIQMDWATVRTLAGISTSSGVSYSMSNFYGKSSYTPMSASGNNHDSNTYDTAASGGTAYAYPSVNVSGGSGGYSYSWSFTSNPSSCSLTSANAQMCSVSKAYNRYSGGSFSATLQCVITDNTGHSVTVSNVIAYAGWDSSV